MEDNTALELNPCPFCGSDNLRHYKGHGGKKVQCFGCGASGVSVDVWNARADLSDAAIAAAYEAAANVDFGWYDGISGNFHEYSQFQIVREIRALTPADARTALEAAKREAFNDGIEAAAIIAENRHREWNNPESHGEPEVECDVTACENIATAIRALLKEDTDND